MSIQLFKCLYTDIEIFPCIYLFLDNFNTINFYQCTGNHNIHSRDMRNNLLFRICFDKLYRVSQFLYVYRIFFNRFSRKKIHKSRSVIFMYKAFFTNINIGIYRRTHFSGLTWHLKADFIFLLRNATQITSYLIHIFGNYKNFEKLNYQ